MEGLPSNHHVALTIGWRVLSYPPIPPLAVQGGAQPDKAQRPTLDCVQRSPVLIPLCLPYPTHLS